MKKPLPFICSLQDISTELYSINPGSTKKDFSLKGNDADFFERAEYFKLTSAARLFLEAKKLSPWLKLRSRSFFSPQGTRISSSRILFREILQTLDLTCYFKKIQKLDRASPLLTTHRPSGRIFVLDFRSKTRSIFSHPSQFTFCDKVEESYPNTFLSVLHLSPSFLYFFKTCPQDLFWLVYDRLAIHEDHLMIPLQLSYVGIPDFSSYSFE